MLVINISFQYSTLQHLFILLVLLVKNRRIFKCMLVTITMTYTFKYYLFVLWLYEWIHVWVIDIHDGGNG